MTKAEKKERLSAYTRLGQSVEVRLEELERLRKLQKRLPQEESFGRSIDALRRQMSEELEACVQERARIEDVIAGTPEGAERTLLEYRYLRGCTWEQIAEKLDYSTMHIHRLHNHVLEELPPF